MSAPIDGGPIAANMTHQTRVPGEGYYVQTVELFAQGGLSIRDWFAGMALGHVPALIDAMDENPSFYNIAEHAYAVADAMIAARKRKEDT